MSEDNRQHLPAEKAPQPGGGAAPGASDSAATPAPLSRYQPRAAFRWQVLLAGTTLMLILMAMLGIAVQANFRRLREANRWNVHTYQVLERIGRASSLLDFNEAQLRGFALDGDPIYLRQLQQSDGVGETALRELKQLTSDRPLQQQRLARIEPQFLAYEKRFVLPWMRASLPGANAGQLAALQKRLRAENAGRGRESLKLQQSLRALETTERELVDLRARALERAGVEAARTLVVGSIFVVLLAIGLTYLLARSVRAQQIATAQLTRLNASLVGEVAERRTAEELLRASEIGFRHLAEDSLDMICRHAPDGTLTYVSPAARPLLGYAPAEMIGVHPRRFHFERPKSERPAPSEPEFAAQLRNTQQKPLLRAYRHANGSRVWLEVVGHAIVDSENGRVRAWHTTARDVSARVREEKERARLLAGLRAVVEIADELIAAPDEEALLRRAVEMMHRRVGLKRCSIYLSVPTGAENEAGESPFSSLMRGTFGTDENGDATAEDALFYDINSDPNPDDITPAPGERWIVRRDQIRFLWREGKRIELPGRGWLARTPIATRGTVIGLFFHDSAPTGEAHDIVDQQLVAVFCSLLGALIERGRSQRRMTRQQRLLESVMENAPLFLYSVDCNEKFTLATGKVLPLLGLNPGALLGQRMSELLPEESPSVQGMRRALRGESMQQEMLYADHWLKMWRQPIHDDNGEISGMIGIGMDLTQQRRAQNALQESETRYRQVADTLQDVLFQTDDDGHWTFLNPAWTEITGYSIESSLSAPCARAICAADRAAFAALIESARTRAGESADVPARVLRFRTQEGEVRWLDVALRANFNHAGEFCGTAGTLRDVTGKVRAENELRETLEMKRAILQGASYAIISTDANGIIQTFNPAAEKLIGVSADEVVGKKQPTFFHDPIELQAHAALIAQETGARGETEAPGFETLVARGQIDGGNSEAEWNCVRADGTKFPMRISHSVLRGPDGEITGHVAIGYDLTETRRAENLKNEFVSVVSHELRTPLTSIRGALGLLSGGVAGELSPSAAQMIGIAQKNADRLVLLINDILDIEKIESGKMRFEMGEISLATLLETALESNRGYAQTLGVEIELESLAPALRNATLSGDEPRLQQVLSNLISNACKWTPPGTSVKLRARLWPACTPENPRVSIEVQDAGPGVPPAFESRLFERFAQADGSATRGKGGTGLGLAVTQAIVEKHGGAISYRAPDAECGRAGATFHFDLPASHIAFVSPPANAAPRMLVIEDDEDAAAVTRAILEDVGYAVEIAYSRAQALAIARDGARFEGATLDLHLPDGNGLDLIVELRQLPATRDLPVVVISSFLDEHRDDVSAREIKHWFPKPVEPRSLLAAIASWYGAPASANRADNGGRARVLHVEDDDDVRRVVAMILSESSELITAATLAQARVCLREGVFDLALLDIGLPDGNGLDLLEQLGAQKPPVPAVIFSAREEEAEAASNVAAAFIKSRTLNDTLRAKVEELLRDKALDKPEPTSDSTRAGPAPASKRELPNHSLETGANPVVSQV